MGRSAEIICLVRAGRIEVVEGEVEVALRADAHELQRLVVGERTVLVWVPPSSRLSIFYHPCAFWQLGAAWLDYGGTSDRTAYGRRTASAPPVSSMAARSSRPTIPSALRPMSTRVHGGAACSLPGCVSSGSHRAP
jgi:hypothetical protein